MAEAVFKLSARAKEEERATAAAALKSFLMETPSIIQQKARFRLPQKFVQNTEMLDRGHGSRPIEVATQTIGC